MTPAARVQAAIDVLDAWVGGVPAEAALTQWARQARYAGSKDRAAVRDHVYQALRVKGRAGLLGGGDGGRALILGMLRLAGADLDELFTGARHAPAPLSEAEGRIPATMPDALSDIPSWMWPRFEGWSMDELRRYAQRMAERAPVYLRVNTAKATREEVQSALQTAGIVARSCPDVATALEVVEGARRLAQAEPYRAGQVELQDLSVQAAVLACPWPASGRILDFCAGGGGKALAIAPLTQARLFAHDANPRRMRDLPDRARRAGVRIERLRFEDLAPSGPFEAILCDVPCSGSGTWRRDPEARWRLSPEALDDLCIRQAEILDQASDLLLPGGCLVYMTCSVFASENDDQIQRFLARRPGWDLMSSAQAGPWTLSDGFYHAVLRRPKNT